jgi:hypothetical protein
VESEGQIYCCANCARRHGVTSVIDRAEPVGHPADSSRAVAEPPVRVSGVGAS